MGRTLKVQNIPKNETKTKRGLMQLMVKEAKRRKEERKKKEMEKEVCMGQGDSAKARWKHITHQRVPSTSRCSLPGSSER